MATDTKRTPRAKKTSVEQLAETAIQLIPFGKLHRAPENVRHTAMDEATAELADDIQAHGLLQSLIGYAGDTMIDANAVYIVGGGRRLAALQLLHDRKAITAKYLVPVLIRDQSEAVELSLAENLARRDMNPADEFVAFRALLAPGTVSPADLAKRFGFTEHYVKQRMRLAALAEPILDALRANKLSLTSCYAYAATADTALQAQVFEQQEKSPHGTHSEWAIKQAYASAQATTGSRLFKLVGAEAYEAAGGEYDDDLFDDATDENAERRLRNGAILPDLAEPLVDPAYRALIEQAKIDYPTLHMVELCPGLVTPDAIGGKMPKPPTGYVLIQHNYNSSRYVPDCLAYAVEHRVPISFAAGVNREGEVALVTDRFFVPAESKDEVQPEREQIDYNSPERQAQQAAERLEASIMGHAVRLAALANRKADVEGRTFWDRGAYAWKPETGPDDIGDCYSVLQKVYVTVEEAEAFREQGKALHEAEQTALAEAKAQREREAEVAKTNREQLLAGLIEQQPAVIAILDSKDAQPIDIFIKLDSGNYATIMGEQIGFREDLTIEYEDAAPLAEMLGEYGSNYVPLAGADVQWARDSFPAFFADDEDDGE